MKCKLKKRSLPHLCMLVLICMSGSVVGQDSVKTFDTEFIMGGGEAQLLEEAEWFMSMLDYKRALPVYLKLLKRYPGVPEYPFLAGVCFLNISDQQEHAVIHFEEAQKQKPSMRDMEFSLGKAYFLNYRFDEAIDYLTRAMGSSRTSNRYMAEIPRLIDHCKNGKKIMAEYDERWYTLKNIGAPVNTEFEEYVPLIALDASSMIYTYRGKRSTGGMRNMYGEADPEGQYFEDIFASNRLGDKWLEPDEIGGFVNTNWHDAAIAVSPDGQRLFVYKDFKGGDIYISTLKRKRWAEPVRLEGDVNSKYWEGHASISVDGRTLYFSSDRPGGLGGKDIYKATLKEYDQWGDVENLGSNINTEFDDDAPFIHANGDILYFSSKGHNSMGGYDVFFSKLADGKWQEPVNIGHPVNTPNDDMYYVVLPSGAKAYFSSARQGGMGGQDLYEVVPGVLGEKPALAVVKGMLTYNGRNTDAEIRVTNTTASESYGSYNSNETSGNYLIALPRGSTYKLEYLAKGNLVKTELVDLTDLVDFVEVEEDFELSSKRNSEIGKTDILQEKINSRILEIASATPEPVEEVAMAEPAPDPETSPENEPAPEPEEAMPEAPELVTETVVVAEEATAPEEEDTGEIEPDTEVETPEPSEVAAETAVVAEAVTTPEPLEEATETKPVEEEATVESEPATEPEPPAEDTPEPNNAPEEEADDAIVINETPEEKKVVSDRAPVENETPDIVVQPRETSPPDDADPEELPGEPEPLKPEIDDMVIVAEVTTEPETATEEEPIVAEPVPESEPEPAAEPEVIEKEVPAEPAPKPAPIEQETQEVLFGFDKSTVPEGYDNLLDKLIERMKGDNSLKAEIDGHTDHVGPAEYNDKLSLRRANAVADYLKSKGISADRLIINGYGESRPISPNIRPDGSDNPSGRKRNRRTEVRVINSSMLGDPPQA